MIKHINYIIEKYYYFIIIFFGVALFRFLKIKGGALIFDDSFITFRYAANLASGLGFVYNSGQKVLGTTTPLWTFILAGTQILGLDIIFAAQILSIFFDICICFLLYKLLSIHNSSFGKWAALIWMIYPPAVYASTGGMETSLFVFLNILSFYLISKKIYNPFLRLAAPLALLTRPEGVIIFLINSYDIYINDSKRIKSLLLNLTIPALWIIIATLYFGSPIPFSVMAKRANVDNASKWFEILSGIFSGETIYLLPFAAIGLIYMIKKRLYMHIVIWLFAFIGLYLLGRPKMWVWYFIPIQAGVIIIFSVGISVVFHWLSDFFKRYKSITYKGLTATSMVALILLSVYYYIPSDFGIKNEEFLRYKSLALYVKDKTSKGDAILASDIGFLGYYSERFVLDTWGLVWPPALEFTGTNAQKVAEIAERYDPAAIVIPYQRDFFVNTIYSDYIYYNFYLDTIFADDRTGVLPVDPLSVPEKWSARYFVFLHKKSLIDATN